MVKKVCDKHVALIFFYLAILLIFKKRRWANACLKKSILIARKSLKPQDGMSNGEGRRGSALILRISPASGLLRVYRDI